MAILKLQTGEKNPILRKMSVDVAKINGSLKKFAKDMKETMVKKDGLGLAAPQVGKNIRMIIVNLNFKTVNQMATAMINPRILSHGDETYVAEEGCLSLPGQYGDVSRFREIVLEFKGLDGEKQTLKLSDLNARIVQHEVDHLDGVLFLDRM